LEQWIATSDPALQACSESLLREAADAVMIESKYDGYIQRQQREVDRFKRMESFAIPADFDFASLRQLRLEAREKLSAIGPRSIGQARRISGISPADVTVLLLYLARRERPIV
jgi:tRNA uridine 5-carboxymethylaminomethyl modification enzyme